MGPAGGLGDPSTGEQLIEPGISVGVDDPTKVSGAPADARPCGPASRRTAPPAVATRRIAARRARTSIIARSWSFRFPAPTPAPASLLLYRCPRPSPHRSTP